MQNKAKMDWYLNILKNYLGLGGCTRRKEYWMFALVNIVSTFVLGILGRVLGRECAGGEDILMTIYGVLVFIPWWTAQFRRLHDTDHSTRWLLALLIPIAGQLVIIIFNCQDGTQGSNRFGLDPRQLS